MTREEVFALSDDDLRAGFESRLQGEIERDVEMAHFVAAMRDRGFAMPFAEPRIKRYIDISENRTTPELFEKFRFNSGWLKLFTNYRKPIQRKIASGGKFNLFMIHEGRGIMTEKSFDEMADCHRQQVFGDDGPRDIDAQEAWLDARDRRRDDTAVEAQSSMLVDKEFRFESESEAKRFRKLRPPQIIAAVRAAGLLDGKRRRALVNQ